jgi:2-polyprenyl-3-methyl-5-hydroxy-6-metoxy-1,4-benzoquinol methylase/uncharacterized protein YeeX (DUF496 family)
MGISGEVFVSGLSIDPSCGNSGYTFPNRQSIIGEYGSYGARGRAYALVAAGQRAPRRSGGPIHAGKITQINRNRSPAFDAVLSRGSNFDGHSKVKSEDGRTMQLEATGERFVADGTSAHMQVAYEHLHRYLFAREICREKVVLDIASGEGYGSNLLAQTAKKVTGIDISTDAVSHARGHYRRENLQFLSGDCSRIPLKSGSVDVVVSFETIEHITAQEKFLAQVIRVLKPGGILIISSPDKHESTDRTGHLNPFHLAELYREDFIRLLKARFRNVRPFQQRLIAGSYLAAEDNSAGKVVYGTHRGDLRGGTFNEGVHEGLYSIAVCSNGKLPAQITAGVFENRNESARIWDWYERGAQFREDADQLRRKYEEALQNAAQTQRELDAARNETELALAKAQELEKEVVARSEWGLRLDGEIEALRKIVSDQRAQMEAAESKNAAADEAASRANAVLAETTGKLRNELEESHRVIAAQQSRIEQLESSAAAAVEEAAQRVATLEHQVAEQQSAAEQQMAALEARASGLAREAANSAGLAERRAREIGDLQAVNASQSARIAQLEELNNANSREGADRVASLKREYEQRCGSFALKIAELETREKDLRGEVAARAESEAGLRTEIDELQASIAEHLAQIQKAHVESLAADDRLLRAADSNESLRSEIDRLERALSDQRQMIDSIESRAAGVDADLARAKVQREAEVQRMVADMASGEAQIRRAQDDFGALLSEVELTLQWASALDNEVNDLRASLAEREKGARALTDKVNELFRYSSALEDELARKDAELTRITRGADSSIVEP